MRCYGGPGRFHFGLGMRPFPRKDDYIRMLERYKEDLEAELKDVEREIESLRKEAAA
ncbi:MAG: DUF5320 domain-containing protein [Chloroflexi bacterium]|nr:DUF5320 domain-containing protein [Chloroflexota bacterium]